MEKRYIDLLQFIPKTVKCGEKEKEYILNIKEDEDYIMLNYSTDMSNSAKIEYSLTIPRYITRDKETFEVIGLLQAEMGKTNNGCIVFPNSEYKLINKVMRWFKEELEIDYEKWRWYIRINLDLSEKQELKEALKDELIKYWIFKTKIDCEKRHPTTLTDVKNTLNEIPKNYGTLIIEYKSNLLSQIIKNFVKTISYQVPNFEKEEIRGFMRSILAGEGCVEICKKDKKYRVHISASKQEEKEIYFQCLKKLNIDSIVYKYDKLIISKRVNNVELLNQGLMTLHPKKYAKFIHMISLYNGELEGWRKSLRKPHNKTPKRIENRIIELKKQNPEWPAWKIGELTGVSDIKVQRVLKANNLGKRVEKTSQEMIKKVIELHNKNPSLHSYQIADILGIHKERVERIRRKYKLKKFPFKTPKEKIERIIQIYRENPAVKFKDVCEEVGVSDTTVKLVRKKYGLKHLGYRHLIGCNNKKNALSKPLKRVKPLSNKT